MSNKKAVARKEMSRWGWTWMMMKQYRIGYLMIAPFMIMFFIFTIIPVAARSFSASLLQHDPDA